MATARKPAPLDPAEVGEEIRYLLDLSDTEFTADLVQYVTRREALQRAAFRAPRVVRRTVRAAGLLLQHRSLMLEPDEGQDETAADFHRRVNTVRKALSEELRVGQLVIQGEDARADRVPMAELSDAEFAAVLVGYVCDRDPLQTVAFRHPQVVRRTASTADRLLRDHGPLARPREGESRNAFERRAKNTRNAMQLELRLTQLIVQGDDARTDRVPYDPSPRARAGRRLVAEYPQRFLELTREEEGKDAEVRRQAKARRRRKAAQPRQG
jgi:hypothetical protein